MSGSQQRQTDDAGFRSASTGSRGGERDVGIGNEGQSPSEQQAGQGGATYGVFYLRARSRRLPRGDIGGYGTTGLGSAGFGRGSRPVGGSYQSSGEGSDAGQRGAEDFPRAGGMGASGSWRGESGRGERGYGAGGRQGGYDRGGFAGERGYREDIGYRGSAPADVERGGWTDWREQGYGLGRESSREYGEPGRGRRWQREPVEAREIMTKDVKAVRRTAGLQEVAQIMKDENTGVVPVVADDGRLEGIVTDRDIVMRTLPSGNNPLSVRVADVMTDDVEAVTPDEPLRDVVNLMGDKQIRRVPVVDENDRLVGIISMADVATRADYDEDLQDALEEISSRRSFWSRIFG